MNTSYDDHLQDPPEGAMLAGEYVLGVLDGEQQRAALQRMQADTQFAGEVAAWEQHFAPWLESIAPQAVPEHIWPRIQQTLGLLGPMSPGRADMQENAVVQAKASWWDSVGTWRWLTAGSLAAAAASLFALMLSTQRLEPVAPPAPPLATVPVPPPAPPVAAPPPPALIQSVPDMVATIAADDGKTAFMASIDSENGKIMMMPMDAEIPEGMVPELWLIPPGGAPQSLGVLDPTRAHSVNIPDAMRSAFAPDALVAVSLEPPGGSPTGQPTGPVIAKGGIAAI